MRELSAAELERQDYVDNEVYRLIVALAPEKASIPWDMEMIGNIIDELEIWIVDRLRLCSEKEFYPYVDE